MLEDNFALLSELRRPWLDPAPVQARFLALSAAVHPDRVHNASPADVNDANRRFIALNAAWNCLRDTRERLRHLLELERGSRPDALERLPAAEADFYLQLGLACRQVDQFLMQKNKATSPLQKAALFKAAMDWTVRLQQWQTQLQARRTELERRLQTLNAAWEAAPAVGTPERPGALPLDQLEHTYREWSYLARWAGQIGDRLVQLSL